jgi:hypothetical protein
MERRHSVKVIIKDDMELGRDMASLEIQDEGNERRVITGEANKHALTGATVPFGD